MSYQPQYPQETHMTAGRHESPGPGEGGPVPVTPPANADDQATAYLREIRNSVRAIGIIMVIGLIAAIITGISATVAVSHAVGGIAPASSTSSSSCMSQGGTNPDC